MADKANIDQDLRERVRKQFGATAESYVKSDHHSRGGGLDQLVELAEPTTDAHALDIATGGGHTALALAPHVAHVIASDLTQEMLDAVEKHFQSQGVTNASYALAEAENLPFDDASFDIVTCRIAPHHFSDVFAFCNETARVLKPGGRFVLIDSYAPEDPEQDAFINEVEWRRDNSHNREYTLAEWHEFIGNAGLTIDYVEPFVRRFQFDDWVTRSMMTPEARADLEAFMLAAPADIQAAFHITTDADGAIEAFDDNKVLIRARKP